MVGETSQAINALACFASQGEFKLLLLSMEEFEMRCCAAVQLQGQEGILTLFPYVDFAYQASPSPVPLKQWIWISPDLKEALNHRVSHWFEILWSALHQGSSSLASS